MKLKQQLVKNKLSSIATIEFQAAKENEIVLEERRQHLYRGMKKEEFHEYYDDAFTMLSSKMGQNTQAKIKILNRDKRKPWTIQ